MLTNPTDEACSYYWNVIAERCLARSCVSVFYTS